MTDIVTLHKEAIAEIGSGVPGIVKSFSVAPAKLDTAELPALYVLTGGANNDYEITGSGLVQKTRIYRVQVAGVPIGQADPETREGLLAPLLESVCDEFLKYPSLSGVAGVVGAAPKSDSGIVILPEYGMQFVGFEIRLQVTYVVERNFAQYE